VQEGLLHHGRHAGTRNTAAPLRIQQPHDHGQPQLGHGRSRDVDAEHAGLLAARILALGDAAELPDGRLYAYVMPIRQQALWLAKSLAGQTSDPWPVPEFKPRAKVHGFTAAHPYLF